MRHAQNVVQLGALCINYLKLYLQLAALAIY